MTQSEIADFARRMKEMTAEGFNAALQNATALWSKEQKQAFVYWMVSNHLICSPCSADGYQLFTAFSTPPNFAWPSNIPRPKQGSIVMMNSKSSISAYVIGGTTMLTYEELKSRTEASGDWLTDFKGNGQTQPDTKTAKKINKLSRMLMGFSKDFQIEVTDEAYYSRAKGKGSLSLAYGSGTTVMIVSQDKPKNKAVDPYPLVFRTDMTAEQKRALMFTLLNMDTESQRQAISDIKASLSEDDAKAFVAYLDQEVQAYNKDIYERFVSILHPVL